jgi:hypothetical protein
VATAYLGRSDSDFWDMTPRVLITMVDEWNKIERQKAKIQGICYAALMNGKDPDEFLGGKEQKKVTEKQQKKNAALFF